MPLSGRDMGRAAASKIRQRRREDIDINAPFQAYVSSVAGGMVYIIEDGVDETPWTQGIRIVRGVHIKAGDRVQITPTRGGDYLCVGSINDEDSFAIGDSDLYEANTSTALNSPYSGTSLTDAITKTISGLPAGTYKVVVKGSVATSHSAASTVGIAMNANGVDGTTYNLSVPTTSPPTTRIFAGQTFTVTLTTGQDLVGAVRYVVASGTVTARAPEISMFVKRLS